MKLRATWLTVLWSVLCVVNTAGTHFHIANHPHATSLENEAGDGPHVTISDEFALDHLLSHAVKGELDAGTSHQISAESQVPQAPLANLAIFCLIEWQAPRLDSQVRDYRPVLRPPKAQSAFRLTPPANAPPSLA